jgi:hypothetical protein
MSKDQEQIEKPLIETDGKSKAVQRETLPSGKVAEVLDFKGKHIRQATEIADGNSGKMIFALIALVTTIDGRGITMEEIDEMPGRDVLKLQTMFSVNF